MQNDRVLWTTDTSAGFEHFKVILPLVFKDEQNIDDAKEKSEFVHTFSISNNFLESLSSDNPKSSFRLFSNFLDDTRDSV